MLKEGENQIEEEILRSAREVFLSKGPQLATMQEIADKAGIGRTGLHYYYHKKEDLFRAIAGQTMEQMLPDLSQILQREMKLVDKLELVIDTYLKLFLRDPLLPRFMIYEFQRDPHSVVSLLRCYGQGISSCFHQIEEQMREEFKIEQDALAHLFVTIYGLIILPFLTKDALEEVFFAGQEETFKQFILRQKAIVMRMLRGLENINTSENENENKGVRENERKQKASSSVLLN
ncbi:MAG: TetR/AcrR family transcriptional regulator [Bacteriovoracaceae bacterium]|nr:TetR/AcrR family transcriptional regulator [Bacteriovoracaceae bacterium]